MTRTPAGHLTASRHLPWRIVLVVLGTISLLLAALSMAVPPLTGVPYDNYDGWLRRYLDVGWESNVPTWWASSLHFAGGVLFVLVALVHRLAGRGTGLPWAFFALMLFAFSADEATLIHERTRHLTALLWPDHPFNEYSWLAVGIPLGLVLLALTFFAVRRLSALSRRLVVLGLVVFFSGALGMEMVHVILNPRIEVNFWWVLVYHVEELLEMWGVGIMLCAALAGVRYQARPPAVVLHPASVDPAVSDPEAEPELMAQGR